MLPNLGHRTGALDVVQKRHVSESTNDSNATTAATAVTGAGSGGEVIAAAEAQRLRKEVAALTAQLSERTAEVARLQATIKHCNAETGGADQGPTKAATHTNTHTHARTHTCLRSRDTVVDEQVATALERKSVTIFLT